MITNQEMLDIYSDRISELKLNGMTKPLCEGLYFIDNIVLCKKTQDKLEVWAMTSWRPLEECKNSIPVLVKFDDLFNDSWSVEKVIKELSFSTINIREIRIDRLAEKPIIDWNYNHNI